MGSLAPFEHPSQLPPRRPRPRPRRPPKESLSSTRTKGERGPARRREGARAQQESEQEQGEASAQQEGRAGPLTVKVEVAGQAAKARRAVFAAQESKQVALILFWSDGSRDRGHRRRRHGSRNRDDKDERRKRREEKKARRAKREEKKRAKAGLATVEWGKHGILTEADIYTKSDEFHAWLIGEKMLNPETLSKAKEKEIFKQFMEDYNTGTLPNEKYYDIKQYEQRMTAVRMGETVDKSDSYDFMKDLEAAKSSQRRSAAASSEQLMDRSRLEELRKLQTDRVQKEKMQRLGMDVSENLGVRLEDKLR
ncbi:LOW QUALITY PROTEIN: Nucleic acid binding protein [Rhodotorula toruloides]|nr:LOW QUALITY PROTEIN: Nucleic acid binding protein [Rhodotorula toruloides]